MFFCMCSLFVNVLAVLSIDLNDLVLHFIIQRTYAQYWVDWIEYMTLVNNYINLCNERSEHNARID